jgi:hypothetical protein
MRILSPEAAVAASQPRLNLIFHGLVAFWDADPHFYDVLIPNTDCTHDARYGDPLDCPKPDVVAHLRPFKHDFSFPSPSHYRIEGVTQVSATQTSKPSPANAIILNGLDVDESAILFKIRVPKPFIIRHYRGTETHGLPIAGDTPTQACMQHPPDVVHEVTVFSYFSFYKPRLVGPDDYFEIPKRLNTVGDVWNLCIYAQPPDATDCSAADSRALGAMFVIKSTGGKPNVDVALPIQSDDGPPHRTSIGIVCLELLALSELNGPNECDCDYDKKAEGPGHRDEAVPGGCSGAFTGP